MVDTIKSLVLKPDEMRCSGCFYGHSITVGAFGASVDEGGKQTKWHLANPIEIGQTRNCLNWFQRRILEIPKFIYPNEDDTCINVRKFKSK